MASSQQFNIAYILRLSLVATLGGLLFGYDIAVISGAIPFITEYFNLAEWWKGFVVSGVYLGCMVGAGLTGRFSDRYGRKKMLIISAVLFAVSAVGSGMAESLSAFFIYRLIGGLGVGMASMLSPMYIAEVAPAKIRGRFVALNQFAIVIGILTAYFVNYLLLSIGENSWRWMFIAEAVPSVIFFASMIFVPETPRFLTKQGNFEMAHRILSKIGPKEFADYTLKEIQNSVRTEIKGDFKQLVHRSLRMVLVIGMILAFFQQWSGINVIFFYAPDIFAKTGAGIESQLFQTVIIGTMNVFFTLLAMWLVEILGRKALLLMSSTGMALSYLVIGSLFYFDNLSGYILLTFALTAVASYSLGLAPVTWVILSEIFPNRIRGQAMAVATFALWTGTFTLTLTFPVFMEHLQGAYTFWMYGIICVLGFLFILKVLPETKGKTLEELEKILTKKSS